MNNSIKYLQQDDLQFARRLLEMDNKPARWAINTLLIAAWLLVLWLAVKEAA